MVTCPALPGLVRKGIRLQDAREMAQDAIQGYLESLMKEKRPIPRDLLPVQEAGRVMLRESG